MFFDLPLQVVVEASAGAWFPNVVSDPASGVSRTLSPDVNPLGAVLTAPNPVRLTLTNGLGAITVDAGRVKYVRTPGDLLIGQNGTPVQAFDLPVPWP